MDTTSLSASPFLDTVGQEPTGPGSVWRTESGSCKLDDESEMKARLAMADRMTAVGTLAAGLAHEISNPLMCVLGNLYVVADDIEQMLGTFDVATSGLHACQELRSIRTLLAEAKQRASDGMEAATRMCSMLRDFKSFASGDPSCEEQGPVDLRPCIESALRLVGPEMYGRANLVKEYGDTPAVHANAARLCQVFVNLLLNSVQAIPKPSDGHHEIRVLTTVHDDTATFEVRDTGCGIPVENLDRIFDPFFTTKPNGVGTGLGLYISRLIVATFGGTLTAANLPGQGSAFRVTLPLERPPRC